MLSPVLGSTRASAVSIEIKHTFVRVRAPAATHGDLAKRWAELEEKTEAPAMNRDTSSRNKRQNLKQVLEALREVMTPPDTPKRPIGFVTPEHKSGKKTGGSKRQDLTPRSRVLAGVHFRQSTEVGLEMGRQIGEWAARSLAAAGRPD